MENIGECKLTTHDDTTTLGNTGITVSALGIGAWQWGDKFMWGYGGDYTEADAQAAFEVALKAGVKKAGLGAEVRVNAAGCLDQCEHGVTIVVYPEAVWYGFVTVGDVEEIVREHIVGGKPVERLRLSDECVNTSKCRHRG